MTSKGRSALVLSLLALSLATSLSVQRLKAQVLYGSITGTVKDQSGAVLPGGASILEVFGPAQCLAEVKANWS